MLPMLQLSALKPLAPSMIWIIAIFICLGSHRPALVLSEEPSVGSAGAGGGVLCLPPQHSGKTALQRDSFLVLQQ